VEGKGREGKGERGDALVVVSTDSNKNEINVLGVPRDTYVTLRGRKTKINHALSMGGWQFQKESVENLLGIQINKVFFVDGDNLRDIVYYARHNVRDVNIVADVFGKAGHSIASISANKTWETVFSIVTNRQSAEAAVGRCKNHAKIVAACAQTMIEYYNDPSKIHVFDRSLVEVFISLAKYTDLKCEDVAAIAENWGRNKCKIKVYCVPGKPQNIGGVSYWIAQLMPGEECYFEKIVSNNNTLVV
jgi:hypothetical protein